MAIAFGTSYSGFAFSFVEDHVVFQNRGWVNEDGIPTEKTPTCLLLKPDLSFDSFGYEAVEKYEHLQDESSEHAYYFLKHFMMILHNDQVKYGCSCACLDNSGIRLCWDIFNKLLLQLRWSYSHSMFNSFPLITGKMDSTNCSVPNVWMFIAQLIGHCFANAETRGLFLESPGKLLSAFNNFSNIKTNYQLTKQNWLNCATIQQVLVLKLAFGPKSFRAFRERGPRVRISLKHQNYIRVVCNCLNCHHKCDDNIYIVSITVSAWVVGELRFFAKHNWSYYSVFVIWWQIVFI